MLEGGTQQDAHEDLKPSIYVIIINPFLFLRFIDLFERVTEKRGRERKLPSTDLLPRWLQQTGLGQAEARAKSFFPAARVGGPSWFYQVTKKQLDTVQQLGHKSAPLWNARVAGGHFICYATSAQPPFILKNYIWSPCVCIYITVVITLSYRCFLLEEQKFVSP